MSKDPDEPGGGGTTQPLVDETIKGFTKDGDIADQAKKYVNLLGVTKFLKENPKFEEEVYNRLKECHDYAGSSKVNPDMMFIARALPVINGIIHIASTRESLTKAMKEVVSEWGDESADAISILSALTLIYIAAQGYVKKGNRPGEREAWNIILRRVRQFTEDTGPPAAPPDPERAG